MMRNKREKIERRSKNEDAALEQTFEEGKALDVLPPEDRRAEVAGEKMEAADEATQAAPAEPVVVVAPEVVEAEQKPAELSEPEMENDVLNRVFAAPVVPPDAFPPNIQVQR